MVSVERLSHLGCHLGYGGYRHSWSRPFLDMNYIMCSAPQQCFGSHENSHSFWNMLILVVLRHPVPLSQEDREVDPALFLHTFILCSQTLFTAAKSTERDLKF